MLWRTREVAARLGLSQAKVWALISSGQIESVKIDGARRVTDRALRDFVDKLESDHPSAS